MAMQQRYPEQRMGPLMQQQQQQVRTTQSSTSNNTLCCLEGPLAWLAGPPANPQMSTMSGRSFRGGAEQPSAFGMANASKQSQPSFWTRLTGRGRSRSPQGLSPPGSWSSPAPAMGHCRAEAATSPGSLRPGGGGETRFVLSGAGDLGEEETVHVLEVPEIVTRLGATAPAVAGGAGTSANTSATAAGTAGSHPRGRAVRQGQGRQGRSTSSRPQAASPRTEELVLPAGEEGQRVRREMLQGMTLVFFTAGYPGKRFVFERAKELGVKSVVIDHPGSWAQNLVKEGVIAKFLPVNMAQGPEAVFEDSLAAIRNLAEPADGVLTFCEISLPTVARLVQELGLPGHSVQAIDTARDKHKTRSAMRAAGLPSPANFAIHSEQDLPEAAKNVGFPAVLKPLSGAASLGVKKVSNEGELASVYAEVMQELSGLVVSSGALVKATPGDAAAVEASKAIDLTCLLEEFLDGPEVDVDLVMSRGEWRYAAVSDNGPTLQPYFNETWGVCPSLLPSAQQRQLRNLAVEATTCLGFKEGIFHVECKMCRSGPQLVEVNARMGGGMIHETNKRVWGVDLVEETLFFAAGLPLAPAVQTRPDGGAPIGGAVAYTHVNADKSGRLLSDEYADPLRQTSGVIVTKPLVKPGEEVVSVEDGMPTWVLDFAVQRRNSKDALALLHELQGGLDIPISPDPDLQGA